jgi:hypothetical protein
MMRRTGRISSDNSEAFVAAINNFVRRTNRKGILEPSAKVFIALALAQNIKNLGCSLSELGYLTGLRKRRVKSGLADLARFGLLELETVRYSIPVKSTSQGRVYLPSWWAKGKTIERSGGRPVPQYRLVLNSARVFVDAIHDYTTQFTTDEFLANIQDCIEKVDIKVWSRYVQSGQIILSEVTSIIRGIRLLYNDSMPIQIEVDIRKLSTLVDLVTRNCENRSFVNGIFDKLRQHLIRQVLVR